MIGVIAYPLGLAIWLSFTDAQVGESGHFIGLGNYESAQTLVAAVGSISVDISDSGFLFAAITIGVAPVAVLCAFFADVYARGLGAGVID